MISGPCWRRWWQGWMEPAILWSYWWCRSLVWLQSGISLTEVAKQMNYFLRSTWFVALRSFLPRCRAAENSQVLQVRRARERSGSSQNPLVIMLFREGEFQNNCSFLQVVFLEGGNSSVAKMPRFWFLIITHEAGMLRPSFLCKICWEFLQNRFFHVEFAIWARILFKNRRWSWVNFSKKSWFLPPLKG